jgi:hypothetical protein
VVQYTLAQKPDLILEVAGKDSPKNRDKAMEQLMAMLEEGELDGDLAEGFSPDQLIPLNSNQNLPVTNPVTNTDDVIQAVQVLSNLAILKARVQEVRQDALKVRAKVDILFQDTPISAEDLSSLQDGFKTLKTFAQVNARYQEAKSQAESARQTLDHALNQSGT